MNSAFPFIEASGTPYEIGFGHGSKAKNEVLQSLSTYQAMFRDYSAIDWKDARKRAGNYLENIKTFDPDLVDELRGLADGAGVLFEDILALNVRSELVLQGKTPLLSDGCTSMAATPEKSSNGHVLLGQNWDWKTTQREACIVLKIRQQNKPDILMVTEAGIIGKIGMNSAGLGVCLNALAADAAPLGLPLHIALRGILNSEKLSDAIQTAGAQKLACCANFLVAHANGETVDIEVAPHDYDVLYPSGGLLTHTNHFTSPRLTGFKDVMKSVMPDTFVRKGRITKLAENIAVGLSLEDYQRLLTDHVEYPDSICRHEDPKDAEGLRLATVFSVIFDLTAKTMHLASGQPCCTPYLPYRF